MNKTFSEHNKKRARTPPQRLIETAPSPSKPKIVPQPSKPRFNKAKSAGKQHDFGKKLKSEPNLETVSKREFETSQQKVVLNKIFYMPEWMEAQIESLKKSSLHSPAVHPQQLPSEALRPQLPGPGLLAVNTSRTPPTTESVFLILL